MTKTDSQHPVLAGNNLTYLLTASNAGPADASNLTIVDTILASTRFVSATASAGAACTIGTVGPART